jgi:hypothetical protein
MEKKTSKYFILILLSSVFLVTSPSFGQNNEDEKKTPAIVYPLYNGISIATDLVGIGSKVLGSDFLTAEISVEANLKNRFFPIVELGYGSTNTWGDRETHYKGSAPFFKLGMNYNTMYKKDNKGYLYVGLRYAFSPLKYDVFTNDINGNPELNDPIWKENAPAFNHKGLKGNMHWFELVCGVKVHIYKPIYMGWSVRMKRRLSSSSSEHGDPWFVPGFGTFGSSKWGITYSLIYQLPF